MDAPIVCFVVVTDQITVQPHGYDVLVEDFWAWQSWNTATRVNKDQSGFNTPALKAIGAAQSFVIIQCRPAVFPHGALVVRVEPQQIDVGTH